MAAAEVEEVEVAGVEVAAKVEVVQGRRERLIVLVMTYRREGTRSFSSSCVHRSHLYTLKTHAPLCSLFLLALKPKK